MDDLLPLPPDVVVPDVIGVVIGWRLWRVDSEEVRLQSLMANTVWEPHATFTAGCDRGHTPPQRDCRCGVYALKKLRPFAFRDSAFYRPRERFLVAGTSKLWGRVIEGTAGFRCQYAYPDELWVVPVHGFAVDGGAVTKLPADIAAAYDVPCKKGKWRDFFGFA